MIVEIDIVSKPISINKAYYKRNNALTKEARQFRNDVFIALSRPENKSQLEAFNAIIDESLEEGYGVVLDLIHQVPYDIYFTNNGDISMRSGDVDNYTKVLQDFLFNQNYTQGKKVYHTSDGDLYYNVGCDDRFIVLNRAVKIPMNVDRWQIKVRISLIALKDLTDDLNI